MKIQIIATKPVEFFHLIISWIIRLTEKSKQSNLVIYFPDKEIVRYVNYNKIEEISIDDFLEKNKIVNIKNIELTDNQYLKIDEYTKSKIGKQKGFFSTIFGNIFPQIVKRYTGLIIANPFYEGLSPAEFIRSALRQAEEVWVFVLTNEIPKGTFTINDAIHLAEEFNNK